MGAVVESPAIWLDMTARENIRQQYKVLGLPSDNGIDDLLRLVGLGGTGKKRRKIFLSFSMSSQDSRRTTVSSTADGWLRR